MERRCEWCGKPLKVKATGRPKRFCWDRCRKAASRAMFPAFMTSRKSWVRCDGKRPITPGGCPASSTRPDTWSTYADVQRGAGDGFGIMLGGGLACFDLDHVTDEQARSFIESVSLPVVFVERSVSGNGVHLFVEAGEQAGSRRVIDGVSVEFYSRQRFIRVTGRRFT